MSMITASVWVPRGAAANYPTKYDINEKELARISKLAKLQLKDAESDLIHAKDPDRDRPKALDSSEDDDDDEGEQLGVTSTKSQGSS